MLDFSRRKGSEIYTNAKVEYFPCFTRFTVSDTPIFREPGWEAEKPQHPLHKPQAPNNAPQGRSISRAKRKIHDIAALNDFQYFVTLTLDGSKIDRRSPEEVSKKFQTFLSNKVRRNGLSYIFVPEYHKDGKGIHLHGLVSGHLQLTDSHHKTKDGRTIYNMVDWKYGFSTCIEITGDREGVARYIAKYVTKDTQKILGNFYYAGGNIKRTPETEYLNLDYSEIDAEGFYVPELGVFFKYMTVKGVSA